MKAGKSKAALSDDGCLVRRVNLDAADWARPLWRNQALPPLPARAFDPDVIRRELTESIRHWVVGSPDNLDIPALMTRDEAWFWLRVIEAFKGGLLPKLTESQVDEKLREPLPPDADVRQFVERGAGWYLWRVAPQVLRPFFSVEEIAELIFANMRAYDAKNKRGASMNFANFEIITNFHQRIFLRLSLEEQAALCAGLELRCAEMAGDKSFIAEFTRTFLAVIQRGPRLAAYVARQADGAWENPYQAVGTLDTLAGLASEAEFVREARRVLRRIQTYSVRRTLADLRLWLAATEWRELDFVTRPISEIDSKAKATPLIQLLARVEAPEAALPMLEIKLRGKAPALAAKWLDEHPLHAAVGLVPVAMGQGNLADAAREHLTHLHRTGRIEVLTAALPHLRADEAAWLQREILEARIELRPEITGDALPGPLHAALAAIEPAKPPAWLALSMLPPIKIGNARLADAEVRAVLAGLKDAPIKMNPRFVSVLKDVADPSSLDPFAWKLFSLWLGAGAPPKDKWALAAIGHLGGDGCVFKLTPLLREWPGESQHQRAVLGLDCLRAIGTDAALMALNGIAAKLKFAALKKKARTLMEEIADARGLSHDQLADRIVPDGGLDERGGRVFDLGPRQFHFVFGAALKPLLRDADGKTHVSFPARKSADDEQKYERAEAEWKVLKKTLAETLKTQVERLEKAMVTGRRWSVGEFRTLLLDHPLMYHLVRQLVLVASAEAGAARTFRVTEDRTFADQNDDAVQLGPDDRVGVVHPVELDEAARGTWGQVMGDYRLIPPFPQMGRPCHRPLPEERGKTAITRFRGTKIGVIVLHAVMKRSGFAVVSGTADQFARYHPNADATALMTISGAGYDTNEIAAITFVSGPIEPLSWKSEGKPDHVAASGLPALLKKAIAHFSAPISKLVPRLPLKMEQVPPIVFSEALRVATALTSKEKK